MVGLLLGRSRTSRRLVHSAVEHSSVFKAAEWWGRVHGGTAYSVGVDPLGRISLEQLSEMLAAEPAGVLAVQSANLEVGTLQPVAEVAQAAHEVGALMRDHHAVGFSTYGEQFNAMHVNLSLTGVAIGH